MVARKQPSSATPLIGRRVIKGKELLNRLLQIQTPCEMLTTLDIESPSNMTAYFSVDMQQFLQLSEDQIQSMGFKPKGARKLCKALKLISQSHSLASMLSKAAKDEIAIASAATNEGSKCSTSA